MKETSWRIFRPSPASIICAATPELARYSFATAVILGDAGRVRTDLGRDPGLATQAGTRTGWAPLHAASAPRWHRLDPARAGGLLAVARMLLDAGADPSGRTGEAGGHGGLTRCAARSPVRPARSSPGCCWSAAPCPATTICTWRGSLDSRGLGWVRLWGYAGRPVLPSGAVQAFDREMGGSWPVTG